MILAVLKFVRAWWKPLSGALAVLVLIGGVLWLRADARADLRREQAAQVTPALANQREAEATATDALHRERSAASQAEAARQERLNDATRRLPDARPSPRARARVCAELPAPRPADCGDPPAR